MISWVKPVNPSHPYLENDPAPSFDFHHLRISPWLEFRARISRSSTRHSPIFPPSSGQRARCTGPASTPAAAAPSAASPPAISEPAPAKAGVRAHRVARYLQLPGNLPDRMASAFQLVNLFQLSHLYQYLWCTSAESPLMMPPSSGGSIPTCYFCGCSAIRSDLRRR